MGVDRADAEASGFELGLGTEGKNKEGFLSKGDPSLRGSPFPWRKRPSGIIPFFPAVPNFQEKAMPIAVILCRIYWSETFASFGRRWGDSFYLHLYTNSPSPKPPAGSGREMAAVRLLLRLLF